MKLELPVCRKERRMRMRMTFTLDDHARGDENDLRGDLAAYTTKLGRSLDQGARALGMRNRLAFPSVQVRSP